MGFTSTSAALVACLLALNVSSAQALLGSHRRGHGLRARNMTIMAATPNMPYDPSTISTCTWWWDNDGSIACEDMASEWGISQENFLYWNPSITADCENYIVGQSYCVEAPGSPTTEPPTSETPKPIQDGMVENCNSFYFVKAGDTCDKIAKANSITTKQLIEWNPAVGSDCTGMWANVYICVGIVGGSTSATATQTAPPTSTSNGVATPTPTQPEMVENCNSFYLVKTGDSCDKITKANSISFSDFLAWNPSIGSDCTGMWANVYICVGIIGRSTTTASTTASTTATTTATTTGNGISTPTPTQPDMVDNCNNFYYVNSGDTCDKIAKANSITVQQLVQWNPSIGSDCTGLWANVNVCIGVIGFTPTPTTSTTTTKTTTTGNGVSTPTPTQDGMVGNCKTFHWVQQGQTCDAITKIYGITLANFVAWNPAVGSSCTGLWASTYACVGLI